MCLLNPEVHNIDDETMYTQCVEPYLSRAQNQILCAPQLRTSFTTDTYINREWRIS